MLKAFDVSVAVFVRGLSNLKGLLTKAEAHEVSQGLEAGSLLGARLAGDMYDLAAQAHWAAEGAKLAVARLLGDASAPPAAQAKSFAELHERIDAVSAGLSTVDAGALEAGLTQTITLPYRGGSKDFRGDRFLTEFAIPSFFFHLTTAYGILRHAGVPLQKGDFIGG